MDPVGGGDAQGPSVAQRCHLADESHDTHGDGVEMSVPPKDMEMLLTTLDHCQCEETNRILKPKIVENLWLKEGLRSLILLTCSFRCKDLHPHFSAQTMEHMNEQLFSSVIKLMFQHFLSSWSMRIIFVNVQAIACA